MRLRVFTATLLCVLLGAFRTSAKADDPNFGVPPSSRIPILFNDRHVYAKPDELRKGRVLAAMVSGATILVPLRSMFEEMDATVGYDPSTHRVTVSKPGSVVVVTVGVTSVSINGEERPLDVPPQLIGPHVYVPLRVLAESMGAYVQWVPQRASVVVRYVTAVPPPAPPAPVSSAAPEIAATPIPVRPQLPPGPPIPGENPPPAGEAFVVGDYLIAPQVYDEFTPNGGGPPSGSYAARVGIDAILGIPFMIEGEFTHASSIHPAGLVTIIGRTGQTFVPSFIERNDALSAHLGVQILKPRIFIAASYLRLTNNYGYPELTGIGGGLEKLPDLDQVLSADGSAYYYPSVSGTCSAACPSGPFTLSYRVLQYRVGGTFAPKNVPVFVDFGYEGEYRYGKSAAPGDTTRSGPYAGIGVHF